MCRKRAPKVNWRWSALTQYTLKRRTPPTAGEHFWNQSSSFPLGPLDKWLIHAWSVCVSNSSMLLLGAFHCNGIPTSTPSWDSSAQISTQCIAPQVDQVNGARGICASERQRCWSRDSTNCLTPCDYLGEHQSCVWVREERGNLQRKRRHDFYKGSSLRGNFLGESKTENICCLD